MKSYCSIQLMVYLILVISTVDQETFKLLCTLQEVLHSTTDLVDPEHLAVWNAFLVVAEVATVPVDVLMNVCHFSI